MHKLLHRPGEIKRRTCIHNKFPDILFLAEAYDDPFTEVTIITLKQHFYELAIDEAWNKISSTSNPVQFFSELEQTANQILHTQFKTAKEFIRIDNQTIHIGINAVQIDDNAVDKAVELLFQMEYLNQDAFKEFGEEVLIDEC